MPIETTVFEIVAVVSFILIVLGLVIYFKKLDKKLDKK